MDPREAPLSMTWRRCLLAVICWALAQPSSVGAQPTDLFMCVPFPVGDFSCANLLGPLVLVECPGDPPTFRPFETYRGRKAWYPLRCVGPITVEVMTYADLFTQFPLYVEVVPISEDSSEWWRACENLPGSVVLITYGRFNTPCGDWEARGPIDITRVVPLGSLYALRLRFFDSREAQSPAIGCIRVTAHPSAVVARTWGQVKALFR
jgi:hypothetical protein